MIAFTVCSNNYLAEAISLGKSIIQNTASDVKFHIFLSDKYNTDIDYINYGFPIIEIDENICNGYTEITNKYDIVELSTAVKPGVFKFLMRQNIAEDLFYYFDPDIFFFNDIDIVRQEMGEEFILLTPHITKPMVPGTEPFENTFLNYGIYNLGFIALRRSKPANDLLNWWENRTMNFGINEPEHGLFVDQLWINFVPVFFDNVKVSMHLGLNMAYWNVNERTISRYRGNYVINNRFPLVFFHFSSFDYSLKLLSRRIYTAPSSGEDVIKTLCTVYKKAIDDNHYSFFRKYKPYYKISYDAFMKRNFGDYKKRRRVTIAKRLYNLMPKTFSSGFIRLGYIMSKLSHWKE